ncbi:Crp/Fnr family transcriptional regulator [Sphingomonas sp. BAUL-RG-20F-R05-02]|uniref:Crp/Fnr family transcriptional regulator n=1 Tax=Sphingomonas sp. BAUL-RG-20F-R05-02 TaxID=2914830 RepID=UPI001F569B05|nr:Crp/Fnr family transcriptional regulator [Sphingomonas sp. BAUL-RG-20F-R05-02]
MTGSAVSTDTPNCLKLSATRLWISADLDAASRTALERACSTFREVSAGTELLGSDAHADALHVLVDGWAVRYKIMEQGARFISALLVPGDICNLDVLRFDRGDYGMTMVSDGRVAVLPRARVNALFASHSPVAVALWSLGLVENSMLMERMTSIARRSAMHCVAHLLCELLVRLRVVGKAEGNSFEFPLTQELVADALGMTAVHVNRTMRSLRAMGLVSVQNRRVTIHDWAGLSMLCGFRAEYLRLETIAEEYVRELPPGTASSEKRLLRNPVERFSIPSL